MITTKSRNGYSFDLGTQCDPVPDTASVNAYYNLDPGAAAALPLPGSGHMAVYDPYADDATLKGAAMKGLGLVYNPSRVAKRTNDSLGPWLDDGYHVPKDHSPDPCGDQLGAISTPTDLDWPQGGGCYGPVRWGWIDLAGARGLGRRTGVKDARDAYGLSGALGETTEAVEELTKASTRAFWLALVSTSAVVTLAGVNLFRLWKEGRKPLSGWRKRR